MCLIFVLLLLPLLATVSAQFNPGITVTCDVGPSYVVALTAGSTTGVIFIDGQCGAQPTAANGTYTFDAASCTNGIPPALGSPFKVVVQEYQTINLASDKIVEVTCSTNTTQQTASLSVVVSGESYDSQESLSVAPSIILEFKDPSSNTYNGGNIGDDVNAILTITASEAAVFDYQITTMDVTAGTYTEKMIDNGCTQFSSIISQPAAQSIGLLQIPFKMFIPRDTSVSPTLPGTGATTLTFSFVIEVCDSTPGCNVPDCGGRRKRSVSSRNNSTFSPVELAAALIVYPPGHRSNAVRRYAENESTVVEEACLSRTPIIGILVGLSVALVVCLSLTAFVFCKVRRPVSEGSKMSSFSSGYTR